MFYYLTLLFLCLGFGIITLITLLYINKFRTSNKIKNFTHYLFVLEYHMKKAYDIVYKDKILIYSLESTKLSDEEFNVASKEFALLVLKLIGPNLKDEFIELYGDEETLIFNLIEYFNTNFEDDQIRQKARENLFDKMDNI